MLFVPSTRMSSCAFSTGGFSFLIEDPEWSTTKYQLGNLSEFWGPMPSRCRRVMLGNTEQVCALLLAGIGNLMPSQTIYLITILEQGLVVPKSVAEASLSRRELISWSTREAFVKPLLKVALEAAKEKALLISLAREN